MSGNISLSHWICPGCGAETSGMYCKTCKAPADIKGFAGEKPMPEAGHFPTLREVRAKEERHGELRLVDKDMPTYQPETIRTFSVDEEKFERFRKFVEKENLAAWSYLRSDPKKQMMVHDYSSHSGITLTFDDTSVGGHNRVTRSIDREAVSQQGGAKVFSALVALLKECKADSSRLLSEETVPNPYMNNQNPSMVNPGSPRGKTDEFGFVIAGDDTWTCPTCGNTGNSGKFCPECGSGGPEWERQKQKK